jgi:hypothetical protein
MILNQRGRNGTLWSIYKHFAPVPSLFSPLQLLCVIEQKDFPLLAKGRLKNSRQLPGTRESSWSLTSIDVMCQTKSALTISSCLKKNTLSVKIWEAFSRDSQCDCGWQYYNITFVVILPVIGDWSGEAEMGLVYSCLTLFPLPPPLHTVVLLDYKARIKSRAENASCEQNPREASALNWPWKIEKWVFK